jgi:transcriptional regulator with XRE-family HTH domain
VPVVPERIRAARLERGLSLAQVAGVEVSRAFIHLVEQGVARPSLPVLELIAERTGKHPDYFLKPRQGEGHEESPPLPTDRLSLMRSLEQLRREVCPDGPDVDGCGCRLANRGDDGLPVGEGACTGCADLETAVRVLAVMTDTAFARLVRAGAGLRLPRAEREL